MQPHYPNPSRYRGLALVKIARSDLDALPARMMEFAESEVCAALIQRLLGLSKAPIVPAKGVDHLGIFEMGDERFVIIRADLVTRHDRGGNPVVGGDDFLLVFAIDAMNPQDFASAIVLIENATGGVVTEYYHVAWTIPNPPQRAHCFVDASEHRAYPLHEYSPPGRHPKSPGANPWG